MKKYLLPIAIFVFLSNHLRAQCIDEEFYEIEVVQRSCGGDLSGPFYPGEEVRIQFFADWSSFSGGNDWYHGFIPSFGTGWDLENFDYNSVISNSGEYFPGSECGPLVTTDVSGACTFIDAFGNLQLCNTDCEDCPCEDGLTSGEALPGGWFINSNGGSPTCDPECMPAGSYGQPGGNSFMLQGEMTLMVKQFVDVNCEENKDLRFDLHLFGDALTGCWEDQSPPEIKSFKSPEWEVDCSVDISCEGYPLMYQLYVDANQNGEKEEGEYLFRDGSIIVNPQGTVYYDNPNGNGTAFLPEGSYIISYNQNHSPEWLLTSEDSLAVELSAMNTTDTVVFGVFPDPIFSDFTSSITTSNRRCLDPAVITATAFNRGYLPDNGILWIELDEKFEITSMPNANYNPAPNLFGWIIEDVLPFEKRERTISVVNPGPPDVMVGVGMYMRSYVTPLDDLSQETLYSDYTYQYNLSCSYDPNDKLVFPFSESGITDIETDVLNYTIRFQNTGNAEAQNIRIEDILSTNLKPESFRFVGTSHPEFITISRTGRRMEFLFTGINLPDSTSNFEASQGFVQFSIGISENVEEGSEILNSASIFFDQNPAIITNETRNILYADMDQDGFFSIEDCNDMNADINPDAEEIANNDVDENCDDVVLIIDVDMDGFNSDEDCDDMNADINPDAEEIANNDVDENCDDVVLIIDDDMDGFNSDEDCDDMNADINPDAEEIANNGIDEDCDGEDLVIISANEETIKYSIYPSPVSDFLNVQLDNYSNASIAIFNVEGILKFNQEVHSKRATLDLTRLNTGLYLIRVTNGSDSSVKRFIKH